MSYDHAGKVVARALKNEGVEVVFTLCGGHVAPIYDGCLDESIRVVDVRHEATAVFAADAWARLTGRPGVAIVTAGPGVTNAVTGIANAYRAQSPAVIIGGQGPSNLLGKGSLQEMDLIDVLRPITKWQAQVTDPKRVPEMVATAFRHAMSGVPGPVYLEMPVDMLYAAIEPGDAPLVSPYSGRPTMPGDPDRVTEAHAMLRAAQRPVVLIGSQIRWSRRWEVAREFAAQVGAPVYLNGMARGLLTQTWSRSRKAALAEADLVLAFGVPLDFRLGYGQAPTWNEATKLIRVDLDPAEPGRNRSADVAIAGDTAAVISQMLALGDLGGQRTERQEWVARLQAEEGRRRARMEAGMVSESVPVDPLRFCAEIDAALPENTVVIGDGGDIVSTAAYVVQPRSYPSGWMDPGPLGTLGVGMGFAMAAKLARPDSAVVLILGDGTAGINLMEVEAAARQSIPFVVVIGNDAAWTQIRRDQVQIFGQDRGVATSLNHTRYDLAAAGLGAHAEYVERPEEVRPALERALACGRVAVVNVKLGSSDFRAGSISI